jgi:Alpha/beta hydrolase family
MDKSIIHGILVWAVAFVSIAAATLWIKSAQRLSGGCRYRAVFEGIPMRPTCVVTLVHGTWAPEAAWTKTTSPLVEALSRSLGDGVQVEPFQWSGSNSHYARSRAATALRQHIQKCSERYFGANQFVIAHSHGGNVALYALRDPEVQRQVRGTVCLSTPFIYCRRRELGQGGLASVGFF